MLSRGLKITAAIVGLMILVALGLYAYDYLKSWDKQRNSPYNKPGTVWTDSVLPLGFGTDLILLQDGSFASTNVCDICPGDDFARGAWLDAGDRIILTPSENPDPKFTLVKEARNGCVFLVDGTPNRKHHPTFVKKSDAVCIEVRLSELEKEFNEPRRKSGQARP